tara:strand:+ start:1170 stop:2225 length:1056 start_codon:yes stop_codon:yes gene_type:complete
MKIAITGETGFLGYHLTQYYTYIRKFEVIKLGRDYIDNILLLKDCDLLIHCAGVNRGDNVYDANITLTKDLVTGLYDNDISIDIKFMSSIQEGIDSPYGNSKLTCKKILSEYCNDVNVKFESYKLPNLYGPFGKPNYNSFINTFCYNLINNVQSKYNNNIITLTYVYDAINVIDNKTNSYNEKHCNVTEIYKLLKYFHETYSQGDIPKIDTQFNRNLFNTYRSFAPCKFQFKKHIDDRGHLVELIKSKTNQSQIFFSVTKPRVTRGNHFHFNKIERFCVLNGNANISLRKLGTNEIITYNINGDDNIVVDMPILYTHNITNIGTDNLICLFWVDEIFNPNLTDTYHEKVIQ